MFLFNLFGLEITVSSILLFLLGVLAGCILTLLIYAILVIASLGSKKFVLVTNEDDLSVQDVKNMIAEAQKTYKDKSMKGDDSRFSYCSSLCKDLAYSIAVIYSPKSKYPMLEISIEEALLLTEYIRSRISDILDKKAISLIRKRKISTIVNLTKKTNSIMKNEVVEVGFKISKFKKNLDYIISAPYRLFKSQIYDRIINLIIDKLCLIIIAVCGEEAYKIYSKKALAESIVDDILENELNEMDNEIKSCYKELNPDLNIDSDINSNNIYNYRFKGKALSINKKINNYVLSYNDNYKFKTLNIND